MMSDFKTLSENSRIWIYQSNRSLTQQEKESISKLIEDFLNNWNSHGVSLNSGFEIKYNRFIVIAQDQNTQSATGCSIDSMVHFIQKLEKQYNISLLDKLNVSYKQGDYIAYKSLKDFKKMVKDGAVSKNTIVFNNLVQTKLEYTNYWEVPAFESW
ncbi:MAG: ABC transporter ATPase, partial [Flavobacteriaceae bacterium]